MWPFRKRWKPKPGDHVRIEFEQDGVPVTGGYYTKTMLYVRKGVVSAATANGKQIQVQYTESYFPKGERWIWLETQQAQPIVVLEEPRQKQQPPLVDARVLEVVVELQRAVGSTDALIDLLWSVGSAYGVKKEKAS